MPVFNKHKITFLHIGKTGGFSVEKALGLPPKDYRVFDKEYVYGLNKGVMTQHARLPYIQSHMTDIQKTYKVFTVIRNPWYRMVSAFYYLYHGHMKKFGSFDDWLIHKHNMVTKNKYREGSHYTPQIEFTHVDGEQVADYILRTEQLSRDWEHFCFQTNIESDELPNTNVSNLRKKPYLDHYDDNTKDMVHEMYAEEIQHFNYKYE